MELLRQVWKNGNTSKGFLSHASEYLSGLREHREHRLYEKTASSLVADLSRPTDLATVRQVDIGGILHQQGDFRAIGLFPGLLQMWLHQCSKRHVRFLKQTIQRFYLFPIVHLSWQRTHWVFCQVAGRFDRASRYTPLRSYKIR